MKTRTDSQSANAIAQRDHHIKELHDLVKLILSYAEDPVNWPLSQDEQVRFIRYIMHGARTLRNSEDYCLMEVILAAS